MKSINFFLFLVLSHLLGLGQQQYWQQKTDFVIDVALNDSSHSLDGFLKLQYTNNSPDTLYFIWFHLWPNAFKNDRTAFSEQLLQNGRTDFYFSGKEDRGYINRLDFRTGNVTLETEDHPLYIDVIKVYLEVPLAPGGVKEITTPFHVQIPKNFSRGGRSGRSYQLTQWYPKPAVYDRKGWHPMPYLDQGEFYSEFGNFEVRITIPDSYKVAATGKLQNPEVIAALTESTTEPVVSMPLVKEKKISSSIKGGRRPTPHKPTSSAGKKTATGVGDLKKPAPEATQAIKKPANYITLKYRQDNVHDFAWFADKNFVIQQDTIQMPSGRIVKASSYYVTNESKAWKNSIQYIKDAIRFRSMVMGEYPFETVTVVEAKMGFDGGMEYPTITSIHGVKDEYGLEEIIEHEIGHNWLQGILGTNEREHPWMDEGMNTYYDKRYRQWKRGTGNDSGTSTTARVPRDVDQVLVNAYAKQKLDQPIQSSSDELTQVNYLLSAYTKAGAWMTQLESFIGRNELDSVMRDYFAQWKFKHPYPEDFRKIVQSHTGKDVSSHFSRLETVGSISEQKRTPRPALFFSLSKTDKYHYLNFLPAAGYNKYDGFMAGGVVHNYNFPSSGFQFVVAPLYGFQSKNFNGIGMAGYSWFPANTFQRIQLAITGARFSTLKGVDSNNLKIFGSFRKIVPTLRLTIKNRNARSTIEKWLEWKTFLIGEKSFDYHEKTSDSAFYPTESAVQNRYLNQLVFNVTDYRALYPYDFQIQLQQGDGFYRANLTSHYFYNYAGGGGMQIRFFAAKFGYIGSRSIAKEFETQVYQPKLTAVRGNEDYTYSNYFIGRNESEYFAGQQIMLRDGGLKLRTDLFQGLQGRSDDWVSSINLNSTLPSKMFPFRLPISLFLDIGTYAGAWKKDATTSRFLYVGGIQLSLFKKLLNIYAPLVYSSEFRDNLKTVPEENTFFKRLSFSIDLHRFDLRKIVGYKVPL